MESWIAMITVQTFLIQIKKIFILLTAMVSVMLVNVRVISIAIQIVMDLMPQRSNQISVEVHLLIPAKVEIHVMVTSIAI
jgi:hypothetical protein